MNDVYSPPKSNLYDNDQESYDYKLYKLSGIGLATFFGTPIAGGYLISRNYKSLGLPTQARNALIYSIGGFIVFLLLTLLVESYVISLPNSTYSVPQLLAVYFLAKQYQGSAIENHTANNGPLHSNWRAFGISILIMIIIAVPFVVLILTLTK